MKPGMGRRKGAAFERHIAAMVVKTFAQFGISKKDCYRTPLSGGHRFARGKDPGDLVVSPRLRKLFPWSVEAKNQRGIELYRFLVRKPKPSWPERKWLSQAVVASTTKRPPLLVFKSSKRIGAPVLCAMRRDDYWEWALEDPGVHLQFRYAKAQWLIMDFVWFLRKMLDVNCNRKKGSAA